MSEEKIESGVPEAVAFRRGLFNLHTRRFGRVAELLVKRLINAANARSNFHDLYDDKMNHRIEVKFSTVNVKHEEVITISNILEVVGKAGRERAVPFNGWRDYEFDSNIQQIKTAEFDILYYGLFFSDEIVIFKIDCDMLRSDGEIYYSDNQHKGNRGEGQFHINQRTLDTHLRKYLYRRITYEDFLTLVR
jgi:hypothetical protein